MLIEHKSQVRFENQCKEGNFKDGEFYRQATTSDHIINYPPEKAINLYP